MVRVVGVVRPDRVVGVVEVVRMVGVVRIVRMVTLLAEHYFEQISIGQWSLLLDGVLCVHVFLVSPPNTNTSLLLTGLLTGVSR